jgi:hypothetical protein
MTKEHIIQEIRRTTKANGGSPLGFRRFELETGIRHFDWFGRYWARWGDALTEAGYAPNELRGAHSRDFLLESFARLALTLGRLPSGADLRLAKASDPNFPNDKTFYRLGSKAEQVSALTDFCQSRPEYQDVLAFCSAYQPPETVGEPPNRAARKSRLDSFT